jgi:hypothetical protein
MTAVEVLGSKDELTDGTDGSVGAVIGAAIDPYREFRIMEIDERIARPLV